MSSFFTTPASQRKRKRTAPSSSRNSDSANKRRNTASSGGGAATTTTTTTKSRRSRPARGGTVDNDDGGDDDASITSSESDGNTRNGAPSPTGSGSDSEDSARRETATERRLKLAERYLDNIRAEVRPGTDTAEVGFDAADLDREIIAARLREDVAEEKGRVHRHIAEGLDISRAARCNFRADTLSVTGVACVTIAPAGEDTDSKGRRKEKVYAYVAGKDGSLAKWELRDPLQASSPTTTPATIKPNPFGRKRPKQLLFTRGNRKHAEDSRYQHHAHPILCIAASADGRFVVTGGAGHRYWNSRTNGYAFTGRMIVWDPNTLKPLRVYNDHRDAVTCLAFRGSTNQLFSGSKDRTIKIYSLNEMAYVETLFGHQDEILDVSAVGGNQERCVSVGARDRTARLWKVVDESQLIFRGGGGIRKKAATSKAGGKDGHRGQDHEAGQEEGAEEPPQTAEDSIDRVTQMDTQLFVTGADSGRLSLYGLHKKKPLHTVHLAHGWDPALPASESLVDADAEGSKTHAMPTPRPITALACVPFSDLFVTGSWDGTVRVWRVDQRSKTIQPAGVLGREESARDTLLQAYGEGPDAEEEGTAAAKIRGVINDLAIFERGERGADGVSVVVGFGKEMTLGGWKRIQKGRNGCAVFDIPRKDFGPANGLAEANGVEAEDDA